MPQRDVPHLPADIPFLKAPIPCFSGASLAPPGSKDLEGLGYIVSVWPHGAQNWALTLQVHSKWALNDVSPPKPSPAERLPEAGSQALFGGRQKQDSHPNG